MAGGVKSVSGLRWERLREGELPPSNGTELRNVALSEALIKKSEKTFKKEGKEAKKEGVKGRQVTDTRLSIGESVGTRRGGNLLIELDEAELKPFGIEAVHVDHYVVFRPKPKKTELKEAKALALTEHKKGPQAPALSLEKKLLAAKGGEEGEDDGASTERSENCFFHSEEPEEPDQEPEDDDKDLESLLSAELLAKVKGKKKLSKEEKAELKKAKGELKEQRQKKKEATRAEKRKIAEEKAAARKEKQDAKNAENQAVRGAAETAKKERRLDELGVETDESKFVYFVPVAYKQEVENRLEAGEEDTEVEDGASSGSNTASSAAGAPGGALVAYDRSSTGASRLSTGVRSSRVVAFGEDDVDGDDVEDFDENSIVPADGDTKSRRGFTLRRRKPPPPPAKVVIPKLKVPLKLLTKTVAMIIHRSPPPPEAVAGLVKSETKVSRSLTRTLTRTLTLDGVVKSETEVLGEAEHP